jgi:uncharacterized protein (DUF488 family)
LAVELFTIGYERAGFSAFLDALRAAGVKTVLDVRDLPLSRRAGFSKKTLAASLDLEDVAYVHLKPLGTPKEGRIANQRREWSRFWSIVEAKLATPEAEAALVEAAKIARASPSCLLCFEADHRVCHRLRVAAELERRFGFSTRHLSVEVPVLK